MLRFLAYVLESAELDGRAFLSQESIRGQGTEPDEVMRARAETWTQPKEAKVVTKEKAAFAYGATVRRKVDPALLEWSGAGVFSARVFPLEPGKVHRIVRRTSQRRTATPGSSWPAKTRTIGNEVSIRCSMPFAVVRAGSSRT